MSLEYSGIDHGQKSNTFDIWWPINFLTEYQMIIRIYIALLHTQVVTYNLSQLLSTWGTLQTIYSKGFEHYIKV